MYQIYLAKKDTRNAINTSAMKKKYGAVGNDAIALAVLINVINCN